MLFNFSSRLNSYFRLVFKKRKFCFICIYFILLFCFFITGSLISFNNFEDLYIYIYICVFFLFSFFLLILVTLVFCCGIENSEMFLVSKM